MSHNEKIKSSFDRLANLIYQKKNKEFINNLKNRGIKQYEQHIL